MPRHLLILLAVFTVLGVTYAVTTPLFEASDELWHYPFVQHLANGGELPVQDPDNVGAWRQEASQPPLYYYLMAWATAWIDTSDMHSVRWLNPHVDNGVITPDGNTNLAIHTSAENFPWRGTVLAVRLIRLLSVLMSAGSVLFTYLLARELFPDEVSRTAAAAFVAFVPMFDFISGAVNNDNLATLLSAVILFLLVYLAKRNDWGVFERFGARAPLAASAALGVLLGMAALTKQSALGAFGLAGLLLAYRAMPNAWSDAPRRLPGALRFVSAQALAMFAPAFLIAGWWYYRNIVLYGDLLGWNAFIAVLGRRAAPANLAQLWGEREGFLQSFWGLFGGVNVPMPDAVYFTLNTFGALAMIGMVWGVARAAYRFAMQTPVRAWLGELYRSRRAWFPYALLLLQMALIFYGLIQWAIITWSSQGRLVFASMSAVGALIAFGWRSLLAERARMWAMGGMIAVMAAVASLAPWVWIAPRYADPAPPPESQLAAMAHRTDVYFGAPAFPAEMRLLGYDLPVTTATAGGKVPVTFYWQALVAMDRDWSLFVHLVDNNEIVVAQRDMYLGQGLMPTRKLSPGQIVASTIVINIPSSTYTPADLNLRVGLYDFYSGERLPIATDGHPQAGSDALKLQNVELLAVAGDVPNPLGHNFGGEVELVGYALDTRAAQAGQPLTLTLYWRALAPMVKNYSVFAHVRGEGESLWAQADSWPQDGNAPTSSWAVGQLVEDRRLLNLKPDTAPGVYDIEVGLYDELGDRLQLLLPDGRLTDNFVYLSKIRVLP